MIESTIDALIMETLETCKPWVKTGKDGLLRFVDPLDHKEISAHYGATHASVGFLIYGIRHGDADVEAVGVKLLTSVLDRWKRSSQLPGFHNDFNNFALCVAYGYLEGQYGDLAMRIKETVLSTADSTHDTVNWIPMRWFVNKCRNEWTNDEKYKTTCELCERKIKTATYEDGFIDDRLPKGMSFNLQYDVATTAVLQFLRNRGENIDISRETGALLNVVAPDGDINYLGRGTNQIFAWGLWIYLLASAGLEEDLKKALSFCADKIPVMLKKNNLMLNEWEGSEKYLWWDYHYCSVYTAHLLFWLVLAMEDWNKNRVVPELFGKYDSGVKVIRKDGWFIVTFAGRTEYLSERGPVIAAIGREDGTMLVKGSFGPWQGAFGKRYTIPDVVIHNYFGIIKSGTNINITNNPIGRRFLNKLPVCGINNVQPEFLTIDEKTEKGSVELSWAWNNRQIGILNVPICGAEKKIELYIDDRKVPLYCIGSLRNQYDIIKLFQSRREKGKTWKIIISL